MEGVTERLGDLLLQCSGAPGATVSGNLTIFLPVSVTNRVDDNNQALDATLSVDYGTGFVPTTIGGTVSARSITFNGLNFTVPAAGRLNLKVSSIRADAYQLGAVAPESITAAISATNLALSSPALVLAYPLAGLFSSNYDTGISCTGSPLPSGSVALSTLFAARTAFASTRLTEGFASAFLVRGAGDDNGTRFLVRYSGFPVNTQLYVPSFVAGSDAAVPTAGGDLGQPQAVGRYVPLSGTLLLAAVPYADSTGAGGTPLPLPAGAGAISLDSVMQVPLTNGAGLVVYEVVDANNAILESAQFPTFIGLTSVTAPATASESLSLAPVSSVAVASETAPVPRFQTVAPASDCQLVGDCGAPYYPSLSTPPAQSIQLTAYAGGAMTSLPGYIPVDNTGGGIMNWTATIVYLSGSGWLTLDNTGGQNNGSVRVFANAQNLAAGQFRANVIIDAGPIAGSVIIPVTLTAVAPPPPTPVPTVPPAPPPPAVTVTAVMNAATFQPTALVPGSLGTLIGSNLSGKVVTVTFDGIPATLLYDSATQINLQVPASLSLTKTSSSVVVTVDGNSSPPASVALSPAWPGIFNPGVLNQDDSLNTAANPAHAATVIQIFATGIPAAMVSANVGGQSNLIPLYAGPAPGLTGVQQVNLMVPSGLGGSTAPLVLCVQATGQQFCSAAATLFTEP